MQYESVIKSNNKHHAFSYGFRFSMKKKKLQASSACSDLEWLRLGGAVGGTRCLTTTARVFQCRMLRAMNVKKQRFASIKNKTNESERFLMQHEFYLTV